jgi:hypothetical protein
MLTGNRRRLIHAGVLLALGLKVGLAQGADVRTPLQAAMQQHIDRTLVDGAYPKIDLATGKVIKLYPAVAHTMVLQMGAHYVLCVDFRDAAGKPVTVDFYLASGDKGFRVFQVEFGNRAPLEALVKAGTARMLK